MSFLHTLRGCKLELGACEQSGQGSRPEGEGEEGGLHVDTAPAAKGHMAGGFCCLLGMGSLLALCTLCPMYEVTVWVCACLLQEFVSACSSPKAPSMANGHNCSLQWNDMDNLLKGVESLTLGEGAEGLGREICGLCHLGEWEGSALSELG